MSDSLAAAAAALGAPEELVRRSAEARAAASGGSAESILAAWAGGAPAPAPAAAAPAPAAAAPAPAEPEPAVEPEQPEPAAALEPQLASVAAAQPEAAPEPQAAPALEPVAVAVLEESFEPVPLRRRIRIPAAIGAVAGAVFGILVAAYSSVFVLDGAGVVERGDDFRAAIEVSPVRMVIGLAVLGALLGAVAALVGRTVPGWLEREAGVTGSRRSSLILGLILGAVMGAGGAGLISGALGQETLDESIVAVPVLGGTLLLLLVGVVLGTVAAVVGHAVAVPAGLSPEEAESTGTVQKRLSSSLLVPLAALAVIAVVVAIVAVLFLSFHSMASPLAIVLSGGILLFAFLGGYRPNLRIRPIDVLVAAVGIGVVVLIIGAVVLAQGNH